MYTRSTNVYKRIRDLTQNIPDFPASERQEAQLVLMGGLEKTDSRSKPPCNYNANSSRLALTSQAGGAWGRGRGGRVDPTKQSTPKIQ